MSVAAVGPALAETGPTWLRRGDQPLTGPELASLLHAAALVAHDDATARRVLERGPVAFVNGGAGLSELLGAVMSGVVPDPIAAARAEGATVDGAIEASPCYWARAAGSEGARRKHRPAPSTVGFLAGPGRSILRRWRAAAPLVRDCVLVAATLDALQPAWASPGTLKVHPARLALAEDLLEVPRVNDAKNVPLHRTVHRAVRWARGEDPGEITSLLDELDGHALFYLNEAYVLAGALAVGAARLDPVDEATLVDLIPDPGPEDAWRWAGRADGGDPLWHTSGDRPRDLVDLHWFAWMMDAWARRLGRRLRGVHADERGLVRFALSERIS